MKKHSLKDLYNQSFSDTTNNLASDHDKKINKVIHKIERSLKAHNFSFEKSSILDIGCALGNYTNMFQKMGADATGIDFSRVAIQKAAMIYPNCKFIEADAYDPQLSQKYDLLFCKGFSGANTHNITEVANFVNSYVKFSNTPSYFVFSYSTNYSGKEASNETANWTREEINDFIKQIQGQLVKRYTFHYFGIISILLKFFKRLMGIRKKQYFYLIFQTN